MRKKSVITRYFGKLESVLSKKINSNRKITLMENDEIVKTEKGTAKVLNALFSNIV